MKKLMLLMTILVFNVGMVLAQMKTVSGVVISAADNQPVIGASVRAKSAPTKYGRITNVDGKFTFQVPANETTLIVSYVGMKTQEVKAGNNLRVLMKTNQELLDEVVVVAYGTAKKESLVGAQANVSAKQLKSRPITNISNALSAVAPGVQVTTSSGQPGSSASVMIRGFGSINASSAPLYVVDGAIFNGNLSDIPSEDIQSISLLKDAASTALYGSSAGNGVILITTKSGSRMSNDKPQFVFNTNIGATRRGQADYEKVNAMQYFPLRWQQWYNQFHFSGGDSPEEASKWANYYLLNDLKYQPYSGIKTGLVYNPKTRSLVPQKSDPKTWAAPLIVMPDGTLNPEINGLLWGDDMDWEKDLFRTGLRQDYSLSGGYSTDKMKSYISVNYVDEKGYKVNTSLKRFSIRGNLSYEVNNWLSLGTNTTIGKSHSEAPKSSSGNYNANSFNFIRGIAPIYPIHRHNPNTGEYILSDGHELFDYNPERPYSGRFNPVYEQELDKSVGDRDMLTNRSFFKIKFSKDLLFTSNFAYDVNRFTGKVRYNNIMGDQPQGMLEINNSRSQTITFNQLLNYKKSYGLHEFDVLLGHESYSYLYYSSGGAKNNMLILGVDEFSNLSLLSDLYSATDKYRKEGYFSRINYTYDNKYNFSLSYRRDGTSRLSSNNRWGNFWSVGAGWHLSKETFMETTRSWLNNLSLRASIGQTGNDNIGTFYAYQTLFSYGSNNLDQLGLRFNHLGNPDLKWETQTSYDLAIDFGIFNRVRGTVEFFNKESKDLLFSVPLPTSTGIGDIDKNIGKVKNYGVEMSLKADIINTKDFRWDINWNGTVFKNKIVSLPEENREEGIELSYKKYVEGGSIQDYYLNAFMGVDPKDGLAMYLIDAKQYPAQADPKSQAFVGVDKEGERAAWTKDGRFVKKHFCGSSIPDLYGGFGSNLSYKGIDFSILFAYQLGGKSYDGAYQDLMGRSLTSGRAMHVDMLNAWTKEGQITNVPRLDAGDAGRYDNETSDRFLISSSALMLKTISLGYNLPNNWFSKYDLKDVRISIVGENLLLLSKRKGLNPMMNYSGVSGAAFYDYSKIVTANLTFSF